MNEVETAERLRRVEDGLKALRRGQGFSLPASGFKLGSMRVREVLAGILETTGLIRIHYGTNAARSASSDYHDGVAWWTSDTHDLYVGNGSGWQLVGGATQTHAALTIGADAAHSLSGQILSAVAAGAAQVGHISLAAQALGAGVKTFTSIPVLPASNPTTGNQAARKTYVDLHILKSLLTTRGDMIRRGASAPERIALGTSGKFWKAGATDPDWQWDEAAIEYVIDGGGSVISTGLAGGLEVPFDCFVTGWTVGATDGNTGAIVVDVWKDTYANYPPTVADTIAGTEKPTITASNAKGQDLSLSSWTQALTKGDWIFFNVDSVATLERVTISLRVDKYRTS